YRDVVVREFQHHRVPLNMDVEMPTVETIRRMVADNQGVAFLPRMCVDRDLDQKTLCEVKVKQLQVARKIRLVYPWRRGISHAARAFLDVVKAVSRIFHTQALAPALTISHRIAFVLVFASTLGAEAPQNPSFNRDVLPILQDRCQECHRPGEIAPMPFVTYKQTRPWAKAIREAVLLRKMPPWFAEPGCGPFGNDRSLTGQEIDALVKWA